MSEPDTYYDRLMRRLKNNRLVALTLVAVGVLGGLASALSNVDGVMRFFWPADPGEAEIVLSQFTLDAAQPHFTGRLVDAAKPLSIVSCCEEARVDLVDLGIEQDSILVVEQTEAGIALARSFAALAEGGWTNESVEAWLARSHAFEAPSPRVREAVEHWLATRAPGDASTPDVFSGVFPVFEASFLNRSGAAILSAIRIEGFLYLEGGDSGGTRTPIRPLAVSHRYVLDLNPYLRESERNVSPDLPLTPPFKLSADDALRIQVQLVDSGLDINAQQYLLRLTFVFSNANEVSSDFFSFSHYH